MGAGTSAEQVADKPKEEQAEQSNDLGQQQQDGQAMEVDADADVKLLHKNGKISILNGTAEGEETVEVILEAEDINGYQEEEAAKDVEQTEPEKMTLNGAQEENMEVAPTTSKENIKEDGQAKTSEINDTSPVSEDKVESPEQPNESQSSEVGFKKVFKFVGFKFTVKKDKSEKSEPVQLLTVKKDEAEVNGTTNQEEHIAAAAEDKTQKETKDDVFQQAESPDGIQQAVESPIEEPEEVQKEDELPEAQKKKEEPEVEKDKKSPESPTNIVVTETSSPFRRFFTHGWAGLRKKTSFKKSREEDPQEVEKHIKGEEQGKTEAPEAVKEEDEAAKETVEEQPVLEESSKSVSEEPKSSNEEDSQMSPEETKAEKAPSDQPEDQKPEDPVKADEGIVQVTGEKETVPENVTPALSVSNEVKSATDTLESEPENLVTDVLSPLSVEVTNESQPEVGPKSEVPVSEQSELLSSTESAELEKGQEVITTEAELLSSQEKVKAQGSPLKKLFSSSGLRKLSGKKSKVKKDDDAKADVTGEPTPASAESPEAAEVDGGDSSPSSPDESAETSPTEKPVEEEPQAVDMEGEGATSDGERKKDGITPWASFKKLVTPKRRPKRPSESDKEDEVEKVKTSTMSSTDSGGSVENQEETKETSEEQKLEKSTEENKKKADSSVSWDALICVGSSKKRARKTSDSDEEEIQKSQEECKKNDGETAQTKDPESESPITSSQEQQVQESPSPDQVGSPTEGDGVSTWQSFKRLVTPRRKSKTKADEKIEENAVVSNPEQSTSEGEGGKEESWVSFKKLIPGRKKKSSYAKQEHAPPSADQPVHESAEDDSDEPAVVPLAEFDAAELEKLNALKSVVVSGPANASGEQKESLEKPSDELVHAVTVTLIEGERAVTSLEERAPSWISAKVTEAIEHANEVEETTEKIKTEITVEENVVLSTVAQVMAETQSTLMNEVELTSEALTALEEAIETSCAEESTEMLSAVSQLGESIVSTEQATPVPEDDVGVQTLQEQKQLTDNILHAVAESAKLSFNVNSENVNVYPNVESALQMEQSAATLTRDIFAELVEEQKSASTVVEEHIERVIVTVIEKVTKCIPTSLDKSVQVKSEDKVSESTVEQTDTIEEDESVSEKPSESVCVRTYDHDIEGVSISAEKIDKPVSYAALEKSAEDLQISAEVQVIEETLDSGETKVMVEESTTVIETAYNELPCQEMADPLKEQIEESSISVSLLAKESMIDVPAAADSAADVAISFENQSHADESTPLSLNIKSEECISVPIEVQAERSVPVSSAVEAKSITVSSELQDDAIASDVKRVEEPGPISVELQPKDVTPLSLEIESDVQKVGAMPVATEVIAEEGALVTDDVEVEIQAEESTVTTGVQAEEDVPVTPEMQTKEGVLVLSEVEGEEGVNVLSEKKPGACASIPAELKPEESDTVPPVRQSEEIAPVSLVLQVEESSPMLLELQMKEGSPMQPEAQREEGAPVMAEVKVEENDAVVSEVMTQEGAKTKGQESDAVSCEVQAEESASVPPEVQVEEAAPVSSEVQGEEAAPVPIEVHIKEAALVPPEVQVEEAASVPSEMQAEDVSSLPSEVQVEDVAPVPSDGHIEEVAPMLSAVQAEETSPAPTEVQSVGDVTVKTEIQAKEDVAVLTEIQAEESVPMLTEPHSEDVPVQSEVQADECTSILTWVQAEEDAEVTDKLQAGEDVPVLTQVQTAQDAPVTVEVQAEQCIPVLAGENVLEVQTKEGSPVSAEVAAGDVPVSAEFKAIESVSVSKEEQGECISLSSEEKIEVVPVLPPEQAEEDFAVSTGLSVKESTPACVEGQDIEAIVSDKVDIEDNTPGLGLAEEVVLTEESSKGDELAEENVSVSTEQQANKDVPISSDAQAGEDVLSKVQAELPVIAQGQKEEGDTTSAEERAEKQVSNQLQTQECVTDVQTEKGEPIEVCLLTTNAIDKAITAVDVHLDSAVTESEPINVKDMQTPDEKKQSGEFIVEQHEDKGDSGYLNNVVNKLSLFLEAAEVKEEIIATDIPKFETSEASKSSEPVTTAAVEENMLAETVKPIETLSDDMQAIEEPDLNLQSEDHAEKQGELQILVTSVSQKAAAIVDAAIEAATNCFVVDASCQVETTEDTTVTEEKYQTEEAIVETSSTTTVHITSATTVEKVTATINENECVSTERQNQEDEFVSQEPVPVPEPVIILSNSAQAKGNETDDEKKPSIQERVVIPSTDLVDHISEKNALTVEEESKSSPISIQENVHKTSVQTDSSTTDTQEKAQPVES